jgi:hypothetical protein
MPIFHPGVDHKHRPSGKWSIVQASPNSPGAGIQLIAACKIMSPQQLVDTAIFVEFRSKPIALAHLNWYLTTGKGRDFVEDANIKLMLETDIGVQVQITSRLPASQTTGKFADSFKVEQYMYTNQDLRFAFGAIDILDFEVDYDAGTIQAWFQDRYEWHPVYPGLYTALAGDVARETNCVHAALVELQSSGAADFWMKGEATVPLSMVIKTAPGATSGSQW